MRKTLMIMGLSTLTAATALAQTHHMDMAVKGANTPASRAFVEANSAMHKGMDITFTGNADIDFLKGMIAHHQGAVDMAQIVLKFGGDDRRVNRMAREIIRAQNLEISWMQKWLSQLEAKQKGYQDSNWEGEDANLNR